MIGKLSALWTEEAGLGFRAYRGLGFKDLGFYARYASCVGHSEKLENPTSPASILAKILSFSVDNVGALMIRIGFGGMLKYSKNKES